MKWEKKSQLVEAKMEAKFVNVSIVHHRDSKPHKNSLKESHYEYIKNSRHDHWEKEKKVEGYSSWLRIFFSLHLHTSGRKEINQYLHTHNVKRKQRIEMSARWTF